MKEDKNIYCLWDETEPVPTSSELDQVENVEYVVIKKHEPDVDGYRFLHGVAIARHKGLLYACWAHNQGDENSDTEVVQGRHSRDGGRSWAAVEMLTSGGPGEGISHGEFLSHDGKLWAFFPHYRECRVGVRTVAYVLNEETNSWETQGVIADAPFWPLGEPRLMDGGNYIMAGLSCGGPWGATNNSAAVAISNGCDISKWNIIEIPKPDDMVMWGESTIIVDRKRIVLISRSWKDIPVALVSTSDDYGRTWTEIQESNLPMTDSKPYAGRLSTGQNYLVCTTTSDCGTNRHPLTIALSRPGDEQFSKILCLREGLRPDLGDGETKRLSYPHCIECEGSLYVAYSAGLRMNWNAAELAIVPLESLRI